MAASIVFLCVFFRSARGAIIQITAGGGIENPTVQFTGWQGEQLANLSSDSSTITASGDLETGSGNRVDDLAARVDDLTSRLASAEATIEALKQFVFVPPQPSPSPPPIPLVCPSSMQKITSNGFEWCYYTTWILYAAAVTLCASHGLRVIEPSSAAKADAMLAAVQAGKMTGNSPWIGLRCRSESSACDHDPSLWSWDSDGSSTATTVNRFTLNNGLLHGTVDGSNEYCAHWWHTGGEWAPQSCTTSHGYQVACEHA